MNSLELRRQRAALVEQARSILNAAQDGNLTSEQRTQYDAIMADVDRLKDQIDREERVSNLETELRADVREPMRPDVGRGETRTNTQLIASDEYRDAFVASLRDGIGGYTIRPEQRQMLHEARVYTAQTVGTDNLGGYTVPVGFRAQLVEALKQFGGPRMCCTVLTTDTGSDLRIPTVNDTASVGELVAENTAVAGGEVTFGQVTLEAYKYSSKAVLIPFELLQDSAIDLEGFLANALGTRLGRITNTHYTTGTNSSQPQGIVTASSLGVTAAATTAITHTELIALEHSVDPAYRAGANWMFADSTLKAIKQLVDSYGRPLWLPGVAVKEPDTILGYPYVINQDMDAIAAAKKVILFGACKNFYIRDVSAISLYRIVDKYIETGNIGFLAYMRTDSKMVDAGTNPVKHLIMKAS